MTTVSLSLLGDNRQLQAEELPATVSPHTGRSLRRYALEFRVAGDRQDELNDELAAASGDEAKPLLGPDAAWIVTGNRYSFSTGDQHDMYTYRLEIQEVEDLSVSALELPGLTLTPLSYKERTEGVLAATFVVEVSGDDVARLEELIVARDDQQYFDVIRRGISDEPVRMRFGRCLWQEEGTDVRRHNLTLVADEGEPPVKLPILALINEAQLARTTERAVATAQGLDALVEELRSDGVLSDEAVARIRAAAAPHAITAREAREYSRTSRLDDYED
ncbi:hypothetical protein [Streptomyces sp. NPDC004376]